MWVDKKASKYLFITNALEKRKEQHSFRLLRPIESGSDYTTISRNRRSLINFCSNDYLGLSKHPEVIERSKEFADQYGAGATSSRLVSGTFDIHTKFEEKLADVFGFESALLFSSGFQANLVIISAMVDRNSLILIDRKCHNSLIQGAILSRATIQRFTHNSSDHLRSLLTKAISKQYNRVLIITETVFSMDGDQNKLGELIELAKEFNAILYSDDAHALGVLGEKGLGLNYAKKGIDLNIGTFGKSFGGFGAFVGCSKEIKEYLINFASGFIYTTALPPAVIGGLEAALDLIPNMDEDRKYLFDLIQFFKSELTRMNFNTIDSNSQIIPILIGTEDETIRMSNFLEEKGLWVSAIRPPTVEKGTSRLRVALSSKHTEEQINILLNVLREWERD